MPGAFAGGRVGRERRREIRSAKPPTASRIFQVSTDTAAAGGGRGGPRRLLPWAGGLPTNADAQARRGEVQGGSGGGRHGPVFDLYAAGHSADVLRAVLHPGRAGAEASGRRARVSQPVPDYPNRRPPRIPRIPIRRGWATRSAAGKATRWSSIRSGFNDKTENQRLPAHTEALHVVERFSRPDFGTLQYEATIEDPERLHRTLGDPENVSRSFRSTSRSTSSCARTTAITKPLFGNK